MAKPHFNAMATLLGLFLAGCAVPLDPYPSNVTLYLQPQIVDSGITIQSTKYTQASINHLLVQIERLGISTPVATVDIPASGLGTSIHFSKLGVNTSYRIRSFAFKAPGTAAGDLISKDLPTEITTTTDYRPSLEKFRVQLVDQLGSGSIDIEEGGSSSSSGGYEAIDL